MSLCSATTKSCIKKWQKTLEVKGVLVCENFCNHLHKGCYFIIQLTLVLQLYKAHLKPNKVRALGSSVAFLSYNQFQVIYNIKTKIPYFEDISAELDLPSNKKLPFPKRR